MIKGKWTHVGLFLIQAAFWIVTLFKLPDGYFSDISEAVRSSLDCVLLTNTMFILHFARAIEYAFPIPSVEPVTKAHCPAYFCLMFSGDARKRFQTTDATFNVKDAKR